MADILRTDISKFICFNQNCGIWIPISITFFLQWSY